MDSSQIAPGRRQITRRLRAARQRHRVVIVDKRLSRDVAADLLVAVEDDALFLHLRDAPVDMALFHFEVRNAITQQPARLGVLLIEMNLVPGPPQLLRAGEARRTRADDGDPLACLFGGGLRLDPALLPAAIDDRAFDR